MQTKSTEVEIVLAACTQVYAARRISVEPLDTIELRDGHNQGRRLHGIVAHGENRVECVIPGDADIALYLAPLDSLARAGWDVWVIMPTMLLGSAHRHLRGADVTLQPWWHSGTDISFGRPEIP